MKITKEDKEWAKDVKDRDRGVCVICGKSERLNAHHIIPREHKTTRLDISNGISLCPLHHRFSRILSAHQHPLAFFLWLRKHRPTQFYYLKNIVEEES